MSYQRILAAVELDEGGTAVLARAQQLANASGAALRVLHVVDYLPVESGDMMMAAPTAISGELSAQAEQRLLALCTSAGLAASACSVRTGPVAGEILAQATEWNADLLVVGHTPRKGLLSLLFSHTEEDVVARAPCDVLALRLPGSAPGAAAAKKS